MFCIGMMVSCTIRGGIGYATSRDVDITWNVMRNDSHIDSATRTHFIPVDAHPDSLGVVLNEFRVGAKSSAKLRSNVIKVANRTWPIASQQNSRQFQTREELVKAAAMLALCTAVVVAISVVAFFFVMRRCDTYSKTNLPLYNEYSTTEGRCLKQQPTKAVLENFP